MTIALLEEPGGPKPARKKQVMVVIGTRPEAIKLAPIVHALGASGKLSPTVVTTAQHRELLDEALGVFGVTPDIDLDIMRAGQSLEEVTSRCLLGIADAIVRAEPAAVLVQGDTCTTLAAALAAFYAKVPVGHVEAGLRSADIDHPFPEEMSRRLVTRLARWHFAPTPGARANLIAEGIEQDSITMTGNSVVDALRAILARERTAADMKFAADMSSCARTVLVTLHRRENWGDPVERVLGAVMRIPNVAPGARVVFVSHANPELRQVAERALAGKPGVTVVSPQPYPRFVDLMNSADLILTDSGGVQEEAPYLGKRVLVLREHTERPEAVDGGWATLVGTDPARILCEVQRALAFRQPLDHGHTEGSSPFGDGKAAAHICAILESSV